jgi:hypothetical protein
MPGKEVLQTEMSQRVINVENAVGTIFAHDITEIHRGQFKDPAFRRGHKIAESDICHLQRLGEWMFFTAHLVLPGAMFMIATIGSVPKTCCVEGIT